MATGDPWVWEKYKWEEVFHPITKKSHWVWVDCPAVDSGEPPRSNVGQEDPLKPSYYPQPDPIAYGLAHKLGFIENNVVKYVTRWRSKGGVKDLKKARECLNRLIAHEEK